MVSLSETKKGPLMGGDGVCVVHLKTITSTTWASAGTSTLPKRNRHGHVYANAGPLLWTSPPPPQPHFVNCQTK